MADEAEGLAKIAGRTVSEVLIDAFRDYRSEAQIRSLDDVRRYALTRNTWGYTETDIPQLIKEVRAEMSSKGLESAKAS